MPVELFLSVPIDWARFLKWSLFSQYLARKGAKFRVSADDDQFSPKLFHELFVTVLIEHGKTLTRKKYL